MTECVKIKCDDCKFVEDCVDYGWEGCKKFTPAPSKPQTNEEWFCQLPTEEKAKFLFEHGVICCQFCKGDCIEIDYKTSECKYNVSPSYSYTGIVKWLKQPHTVKE